MKLNPNNGLHSTEVFPAAIEGKVKGLYIYGEDPIVTDPDTHHIIKALENLDFFVIQELFMTETAQYADVILPGVSYAEKEGTFTNTERRVQRVRPVSYTHLYSISEGKRPLSASRCQSLWMITPL